MGKFKGSDRMRDILADNALLLPALSRFGITLGFGDRSISDVCASAGVDCSTFLAVAEFIDGHEPDGTHRISVETLVKYLKSAHTYFLDYILPNIRRRLIEAICSGKGMSAISPVILKFYDEYVEEVRRHMEFENEVVFKYVEALIAGKKSGTFSISKFRDNHKPIADKLNEIKEILICHFTADSARVDLLNSLLFDIVVCERDLITHCLVEDKLFIPAIEALEHKIDSENESTDDAVDAARFSAGLDDNGDIVLTPREKDIISCIARGLQNKEIAERLFLSVHTVATHRRNICAKLNIHSASGMTIYAILHGLITIDEGEKLIHL